MEEYEGKISGIGNATTRENEITADDLAILRNYIYGWEYGVINREGWNFNATVGKDRSSVIVDKGIMFAYGYFGIFPETYTIPFMKTSATQYRIIYAEIDRSVVPNTCTLKIKNNQGSDKIKPTTFRQDYLTAVRTGVFQLPLWQVKLGVEGIKEIDDLVDKRDLKDYIMKAHHTNATTDRVTGEISPTAIATTQNVDDKSQKLADTMFVHKATRKYIDGILVEVNINVANGSIDKSKLKFNSSNWNQYQQIIVTAKENYSVQFPTFDQSKLLITRESSSGLSTTFGIKLLQEPINAETLSIQIKCVH